MSLLAVVRVLAWALPAALLLGVGILLVHGFIADIVQRWREPMLVRSRAVLYELLQPSGRSRGPAGIERQRAIASLRRLPLAVQEELVLPLGRNLERTACDALRDVADDIRMLERAGKLCASRSWGRRLRGARIFCALYAGDNIMPALLRDPHPAVRAQAADWAAANPAPGVVHCLLGMIDDAKTLPRFAAQDALLRLGWEATEPLAAFLESNAGNDVESALAVAVAMPHPRFAPAAVLHCDSESARTRARAVELLGAVGGAEGARHVAAHLDDGDAGVRAAAAIALGRMGHWPRVPAIALRMRDTSWAVRRAAGLSLRAMGSPGLLMLRRMTSDANQFAADMAQQVLDLPPGVDEVAV